MSPLDDWKLGLAKMDHTPQLLMCGAKPWEGSAGIDHRLHWSNGDWKTTDIEAGPGVDLVYDLQSMWQHCELKFDGIFCPSVLEHVERPWVAMYSMVAMLKPGGLLFVQTHQTFPLHFYPNDYFRFSSDALKVLCIDAGLTVVSCNMELPCTITPVHEIAGWNPIAHACLNSSICGQKPCT